MSPARRRPEAVEMTETAVHQVLETLRLQLPARIEKCRACEFDMTFNIRNGLIQIADFQCRANDDVACQVREHDLGIFLRRVEKWLLRCLPSRMVIGYHGRVGAVIRLTDDGRLEFEQKVGRQFKYNWEDLAK